MAAVEFALIFPVLLLLYVCTLDTTRGVMASRKVDLVSRTISDLTSQQTTLSSIPTSTIATIFAAASPVMQPFATSRLTMTVSALTIAAKSDGTCCNVTVNWSYTRGGTLRPCNINLAQVAPGTAPTSTNIPQGLVTANTLAGYTYTTSKVTYLIVADAYYAYAPFFSQTASWFSSGFTKTTFMVPRAQSGQLSLTSATAALSGDSGAICS